MAEVTLPVPPLMRRKAVLVGLAFAVCAALASLVTRQLSVRPLPTFERLTFRRGQVGVARFAPDGRTVVFDALLEGRPSEILTLWTESPESRALGLPPGSELFSVSRAGELAFFQGGALQRVSLGGGAPRAWLTDVDAADWSPDGQQIAVVRGGNRLEFPSGTPIYQSKRAIQNLRVSPSGRRLAIAETNGSYGATSIVLLDTKGRRLAATKEWPFGVGLAWAPAEDEVWFAASESGFATALWAVNLSGRVRPLAGIPGAVDLKDVSREGKVLVSRDAAYANVAGLFPGETREKDLSWLDFPYLDDISADGGTILFTEAGEAGGSRGAVYVRPTDGSAAVRIGEGWGMSLSPDGKWALARVRYEDAAQLVALPTGPGEPKSFSLSTLTDVLPRVSWFPDGRGFVVTAAEKGHRHRCFLVDFASGAVRPLTPEGFRGAWGYAAVSPDGRLLLVRDARDERATSMPLGLFSLETGAFEPLPLTRPLADEGAVRFSADGRSLLGHVHEGDVALTAPQPKRTYLVKFDLAKRQLERLREIVIPDTAGVWGNAEPCPAADGTHYAYFYRRVLNDLYLAEGLK